MKKIEKQELFGREVYCLVNGLWTVYCDPEDGMNLCRILYDGKLVVDSDAARRKEGGTYGVPILFPTPNRVRDWTFTFAGKSYPAWMHGIVRREPFGKIKTVAAGSCFETAKTGGEGIPFEEADVPSDAVRISGTLSVRKGDALYEKFAFEYDLTVHITVFPDRIEYDYEVHNLGEEALPFGFALHPFFVNESGDAKLQFFADRFMNMDEACLPDGSLADYTGEGRKAPALVSDLDLNLVYLNPKNPAAVMWLDAGTLTLEMGPTFTHLVIYTPQGKPYFCVEPQTCSTDAHNLYAQGLIEEAGLLIAKPGETIRDTVVFRMNN